MPTGTPAAVRFAIDDVQLYGTPAVAADYAITTDQEVYLVDPGESASIALTVTTADRPAAPVGRHRELHDRGGRHRRRRRALRRLHRIDHLPGRRGIRHVPADHGPDPPVAGGDQARSIPIALTAPGAQLPEQQPRVVINAHDLPYLDPALPIAERVEDLLSRMSLAQKAGQMAQAERLGLEAPRQIAELGLGSILSGGGSVPEGNTPQAWADMIDGFQRQALSTSLQIPLLYGVDAVHGHSNLLGATIFPHNIGLGATRDPALVQRIAEATAAETRATGVNWTFAPCLCITRDERWGRSYESFGEDPDLVKSFAAANTIGLQGEDPDKSDADEVLATAKHWAGDGGTRYDPSLIGDGYPIDRGVTHSPSLEDFSRLFIDPYIPAIDARCRLDHALLLECGPRRGRSADARTHAAEHAGAERRPRIRWIPDQRLGGHRPTPGERLRRQGAEVGQLRDGHGDGSVQLHRAHLIHHRRGRGRHDRRQPSG